MQDWREHFICEGASRTSSINPWQLQGGPPKNASFMLIITMTMMFSLAYECVGGCWLPAPLSLSLSLSVCHSLSFMYNLLHWPIGVF